MPTKGTLDGTAPNLIYTPNPESSGPDSLKFTATDGAGKVSNISTVTFDVAATNDAPVANDDEATVAEGGSVIIDLTANDSDVDDDVG